MHFSTENREEQLKIHPVNAKEEPWVSVRHSEEEDVEAADPEGSFGDFINSLVVLVVLISLIQLYKFLYCPILSDLGMSSRCSRIQ